MKRTLLFLTVFALVSSVWATSNLNLLYNPTNGNLQLQNSGATTIGICYLDILTKGDGSGVGAPTPSGIPNVTAGQGVLNGSAATVPARIGLEIYTILLNTSNSGKNGIYSQIKLDNAERDVITLAPNETYDLGNVAAAGLSQTNIDNLFITDPDDLGELLKGEFIYRSFSDINTAVVGQIILNSPTKLQTTNFNQTVINSLPGKQVMVSLATKNSSFVYRIYNTLGKKVAEGRTSGTAVVPLNQLNDGVYVVTIQSGDTSITRKVVLR